VSAVWCDPITGEVVPEGTPAAIFCGEDEPDPREVPASGLSWLPDWYSQHDLADRAQLAAIEAQARRARDVVLARIQAREARWLEKLREYVASKLTGRARYIDGTFARFQFRAGRKFRELTASEAEVIAWAREHAPDAVRTTTETRLLKSALPADCPLIRDAVAGDTFSIKGA